MDKTQLLTQSALDEADVELDIGTVRVRALSRYEVMLAGKTTEGDTLAMEQAMLSMALVDPKLTKAEVEKWQKVSPLGQISLVTNKINQISGIGKDAMKEAYKSFRDDAEPGV